MSLEIYSHDMKILNAIAMFKGEPESFKLFNRLDSSNAKLVAKYILNPELTEERSDEYTNLAIEILQQYSEQDLQRTT